MQATLIESADEHHWVLLDHRVTQLVFDPGTVRLQTWSLDGSAEVRLAASFRLRLAGGVERVLDPSATETLAPVLGLLRRAVESLTVTRAGTLTLAFRDGGAVVAEASGRGAAAWEVDGGGVLEGLAYRGVAGAVPWE